MPVQPRTHTSTSCPPDPEASVLPVRTREELQRSLRHHVRYVLGKQWKYATAHDLFTAVSLAIREQILDTHHENERAYQAAGSKKLYYLSMEFLMGRSLGNNLINLGLYQEVGEALREMGVELADLEEAERDAALGNGGLGRLAACFLDSLATLGYPAYGYGINYEFGLFRQSIEDGYQVERPDVWGHMHCPWLIDRPHSTCEVPVYGHLVDGADDHGHYRPHWVDRRAVVGTAQDMPIVGHGGQTVNFLRLFTARSSADFDIEIFNTGDYIKAVEQKISSERISKVLYPSDDIGAGRELRLLQEYFLTYCALHDIFLRFDAEGHDLESLSDNVAIQLNDTHPSLAVAEMLRVLVDERDLPWDRAFDLTRRTLAFTNHTLLPEALERWPTPLLQRVVPRHLQIIMEVNRRFLERVRSAWPGDEERAQRMSIIDEGEPRQVRMAHLAMVGSHSVNGVAELHSRLLRERVFRDFHELWPDVFNNKTNGVTQRRWLLCANPVLAKLLNETVGEAWITRLEELRSLESFAEDASFQEEFRRAKRWNKERLAETIRSTLGVDLGPDALFDIQAKRIHLYKRQLLHVLYVIHEYFRIVEDGVQPVAPRVHILAGKAAPGYWAAKQIIKLIHNVAEVVNHDPRCHQSLKLVFLPDYRVSLAERIIPAADLSEQISTAGMEASGTGNMKFAMNGALTIGTLDGANIEIRDEVGPENMFLFGLTAEQVLECKQRKAYDPVALCQENAMLRRVIESLRSRHFCPSSPGLFQFIEEMLVSPDDEYVHLADLAGYIEAQEKASEVFTEPTEWTRRAILNVARIGRFSSDRTVREYIRDIWKLDRP